MITESQNYLIPHNQIMDCPKQNIDLKDQQHFLTERHRQIFQSLEEISKDLKDVDDFITVTENFLKREREKDRELYARERRRKIQEQKQQNIIRRSSIIEYPDKENKIPSPEKTTIKSISRNKINSNNGNHQQKSPPTFKIHSYKRNKKRYQKLTSPRSKLYFRNGRVGCADAEHQSAASNIESTHKLVKNIIESENEKPLVSPENVLKVLRKCDKQEIQIQNEKSQTKLFTKDLELEVEKQPQNHNEHEKDINSSNCNIQNENNNGKHEEITLKESVEIPSVAVEETVVNLHPISSTVLCNDVVELSKVEDSNAEMNQNVKEETFDGTEKDGIKNLNPDNEQFVRDQVRHLVRRFTARTSKMRNRLDLPPTPDSSTGSPSPSSPNYKQDHHFISSALEALDITPSIGTTLKKPSLFEADNQSVNSTGVLLCGGSCGTSKNEGVLDPQGRVYISWLCFVAISFLYNAWVIPLRSSFNFQNESNIHIWLAIDFIADIIYLLDVVFFKHRVMYLFEGFWVKDKNLTRKNYMRKLEFKLDILALAPLDLLYLKYGTDAVYLRFPRLLKIQTFWKVFQLLDRVISSPHIVRVGKTLTYMLYMIHVTACSYHAYSVYKGLGTNRWVFNGKGHPYVRCFAFATKTATSIGKNPKPEEEGELLFMTVAWLMGVFIFALLIGQIRDIISTATRSQSEYRQLEDETLEYMRRLNLPKDLQSRVKQWFKFTWDQQRTLDERHIMDSLPANLKTDIAISVHIQTLSKVQVFADCDEALLRDLVLKLRSVTFLPGDYVCRKGEVGKEMYIVKLGQVQVMGGPNNDQVLATLSEGSVFGEISLLSINGEQSNRRTADVKSKGYSNLFVLSKNDLNEALIYYPNAQVILKRRAKSLIRKNAAREREENYRNELMKADVVIKNPKTPEELPKLLQTVMQALPNESPAAVLLTHGSRKMNKMKDFVKDHNLNCATDIKDKKDADILDKNNLELINNKKQIKELSHVEISRKDSINLLSSIQDELRNRNSFINLTDSEKVLRNKN